MAKKKKEKEQTENKFYSVSDWRGFPNYECKHCAFATLDKSGMTQHIEGHIRGNPELAGLEIQEEELPEVDEDHGLTTYDRAEEDTPPVESKETYQGPKKGKRKKVKDNA